MTDGATGGDGVSAAIRVLEQFTQDVTVLGNARAALLATERGFDAHASMSRVLLVVGGAAIEGAFKTLPPSDALRGAFFKPKRTNRERADAMVSELAARDLGEHEQALRAFFDVKERRNAMVHADPSQLALSDGPPLTDEWDTISAGVAGMARCLVHWVFREYPETWLSMDDSDRDAMNSVSDLLSALTASPPMSASLLDLSQPERVARGVLDAVWSGFHSGHVAPADRAEVVRKALAAWDVLERRLPAADDVSVTIATLAAFPAATPLRGASLDVELGLFLELPSAYAERLEAADRARLETFVTVLRGVHARRSLIDPSTPDDLAHAAVAMMFREPDPHAALRALRVGETCRRVLVNTTALSTLRLLPGDDGGAEQAEAVRAARERVEAAHVAMALMYEVRERTRRLRSAAEARAEEEVARNGTPSH